MNLSTLKRYAPEARREFIQAVGERAALFGITEKHLPEISFKGDVAMIDGHAVARTVGQQCNKLCEKIRAAGYKHTMEQVAYTWFNRLVAIRYMELHDYLDHGYRVLSARAENDDLPEILRYAEQINLPGLDRGRVVELKLDGSKDAELYREVLLGQCHALHQAMPFLFETIDEETELLLPENLLLSDSIIRNLVRNSPEEEWRDAEVLGWLYQFYISEKKDQVMARKSAVPTDDIPAVTQLFTPHWIVRYLVENSLGRLWLLNRPGSRLRDHMPYYIEPQNVPNTQNDGNSVSSGVENDFLRVSSPEEIKICDPACGSGHMLTYAFDLLYLIYAEEGYAPNEIPALILRHNLHGLEICPRAAQLAELALVFKAREKSRRFLQPGHLVQPRIIELQNVHFDGNELHDYIDALDLGDLFGAPVLKLLLQFEEAKNFGSLIQPCLDERAITDVRRAIEAKDLGGQLFLRGTHLKVLRVLEQAEALTQRYHVVVANPPYMGGGGMNSLVKDFAKKNFPDSRSDLFAMFIERAGALTFKDGFAALVTMQSWMFLSSYEALREKLLTNASLVTLIQIGFNSFPEMNSKVARACAFVLRTAFQPQKGSFINLNNAPQSADKEAVFFERIQTGQIFRTNAEAFRKIPGSPIAYWLSASTFAAFENGRKLGDLGDVKTGMSTTDNERFVRFWHEVNIASSTLKGGGKWVPYNKGGGFRKWYGNLTNVVNWADDGREIKAWVVNNPNDPDTTHWSRRIFNTEYFYKPCVTWGDISSGPISARHLDCRAISDSVGIGFYACESGAEKLILQLLNSNVTSLFTDILCPTVHFNPGAMVQIPVLKQGFFDLSETLVSIARADWDNFETSWDFRDQPLLRNYEVGIMNYEGGKETFVIKGPTLAESWANWNSYCTAAIRRMQELETENNRLFIAAYGLEGELQPEVPEEQITLARANAEKDMAAFLSYAVGCMMGRYSLDKPGLILANQGDTLEHFRLKIEDCGLRMEDLRFAPDEDGILPLTELPWFDDDVTERVIEFLSASFGAETLEDNLTFLADNIGPKKNETPRETLRRYLCNNFFTDHTQTYKKRPIYWLFSSGKEKAFQALVYLHRYHPGTLARMRTEYVVPLLGRIPRRIEDLAEEIETAGSTAQQTRLRKQKDKLGKQLDELRAFDEKLRHAADQRISIDLDDGVKVNYGKFDDLLADVKKITGEKE